MLQLVPLLSLLLFGCDGTAVDVAICVAHVGNAADDAGVIVVDVVVVGVVTICICVVVVSVCVVGVCVDIDIAVW